MIDVKRWCESAPFPPKVRGSEVLGSPAYALVGGTATSLVDTLHFVKTPCTGHCCAARIAKASEGPLRRRGSRLFSHECGLKA